MVDIWIRHWLVLTIYLYFVLQVADTGVQRLGDRSHCLTELHLDYCRELSSLAVETLAKVWTFYVNSDNVLNTLL